MPLRVLRHVEPKHDVPPASRPGRDRVREGMTVSARAHRRAVERQPVAAAAVQCQSEQACNCNQGPANRPPPRAAQYTLWTLFTTSPLPWRSMLSWGSAAPKNKTKTTPHAQDANTCFTHWSLLTTKPHQQAQRGAPSRGSLFNTSLLQYITSHSRDVNKCFAHWNLFTTYSLPWRTASSATRFPASPSS